MNQRATGQSSFCDLAVAALGGPKTAALLEKLGAAVPWKKLVEPVLALPEYAKYARDPSRPGERPIDPLVMLRATMLAKWFNLSDPQAGGAAQGPHQLPSLRGAQPAGPDA